MENHSDMHIQVLYVDSCPHWKRTIERVRLAVGANPRNHSVEAIRVDTMEDATRLRFLGSPTVRIEGVDIDPKAQTRTDFGLACRLYGESGLPTVEMIAAAIEGTA